MLYSSSQDTPLSAVFSVQPHSAMHSPSYTLNAMLEHIVFTGNCLSQHNVFRYCIAAKFGGVKFGELTL